MVELKKIENDELFKKLVDMKLPPEQSVFVAPNVVSFAQAWLYYDSVRPLAVMSGEQAVGFVMLDWDEQERVVGLWRFMIAFEQQGKGYGRQAVMQVIERAKQSENIDSIVVDYVIGNERAAHLYRSVGFTETGKIDNGEIVMKLNLTDKPKVATLQADDEDAEEIMEMLSKSSSEEKPPREYIAEKVDAGKVTRIALYGETIGICVDSKIFMQDDMLSYLEKAKEKLGIKD